MTDITKCANIYSPNLDDTLTTAREEHEMNVITALVVGVITGVLGTHIGQFVVQSYSLEKATAPTLIQRTYSLSYNYGKMSLPPPTQSTEILPNGSGAALVTLCGDATEISFTLELRDQVLNSARASLTKQYGSKVMSSITLVPISLSIFEERPVNSCSKGQP